MRRAVVVLVAALGLTLTPVIPAVSTPTAEAAPSDVIALVVEGTGYGHGRGMSQWGAYGWAVDQSKSWTWILDHYYGGTTLGDVSTAQSRIKVRLLGFNGYGTLGVTTGSGTVSGGGVSSRSLYAKEISNNQFQIYGSTSMACPAGATPLVVPNGPIAQNSADNAGVRQIQTFLNAYRVGNDVTLGVDGLFGPQTAARVRDWQTDQGLPSNGIWDADDASKARALIGSGGSATWTLLKTVTGPVAFTTANGENSTVAPESVLGVCDAAGKVTHYRGEIEFHNASGNQNAVVNEVKTEDYLRGVVPKEISASWVDAGGGKGANAVRAQAVAARSYAIAYTSSNWAPAQICDSQSCQVYFGSATRSTASSSATKVEYPGTDLAIAVTAGKVRKWKNGSVVSTEFSASNGPRTAGKTFPAVDDAAGDRTSKNPNHKWTRVLPAAQVAADYGIGTLLSATMVDGDTGYDGIWWNKVRLVGTSKTVDVDAWTFMSKYRSSFGGLMSPGFTVRTVTRDTTAKTFAMIGDSVGNSVAGSVASEFSMLVNGTFASATLNMRDGRCIAYNCVSGSSLSNGAAVAATLPKNLDLVVVELGYNQLTSGGMAADIDTMMNALVGRGVKQVAWVNLATAPGVSYYSAEYAKRNTALNSARSRWPNLTVLDWNAASTNGESSRWFADHAHLTATGQAQFAVWLRTQIQTLAPPPQRLAPPKRLEIPVVGEKITGVDGVVRTVPADAAAVAVNVTVVDAEATAFATVWPCGTARPTASNVNFPANTRVANGVIAPIGANGSICLYAHARADIVVDLAGWFVGGSAASLVGGIPSRVVDTRENLGHAGKVRPQSPIQVPITGRKLTLQGGSTATIPSGASAVALNVTAVDPLASGFVTVWECGTPRPTASNLNFTAGQRIANNVVTSIGANGSICIYSHAVTDLVVDVAAWFVAPSSATGGFSGNVPKRIIDTRDGTGGRRGVVTPGTPLTVPVVGTTVSKGGKTVKIPATATAVALNLTIVDSNGPGFATVWPCGTPRPTASNVNFTPGRRVANGVLATLSAGGSVCVYVHASAHVVVDVVGWFDTVTGPPGFVGAPPKRLVDTRVGLGPKPVG